MTVRPAARASELGFIYLVVLSYFHIYTLYENPYILIVWSYFTTAPGSFFSTFK